MFWIAAYHKPFHVDEFYSWVYAERSSFQEIFCLKEFGIGHPPLFHLIQKAVQVCTPNYHPIIVRLANYFIGSACLVALITLLSHYKNIPIFYYGLGCSAAFLDTFVFSRMWGLVCLLSFLLVRAGEIYTKKDSHAPPWTFMAIYGMGLFSDYSFILLAPYFFIILLCHTRYLKHFVYAMVSALCMLWVSSSYIISLRKGYDTSYLFYSLVQDLLKIAQETGLMLFRLWFEEPFMAALLLIIISLWLSLRKVDFIPSGEKNGNASPVIVMTVFIILILLKVLVRNDIVRVRYAAAIVVLTGFVLALHMWRKKRTGITSENSRLLTGTMCALLILASISPFFWTDLRYFRYIIILLPFILILIYRNYDRITLSAISVVFILSGLLYVSSNIVSDYYPPPSFEKLSPVIFKDEFAYSNQYMRAGNEGPTKPYLLRSKFDRFCKTCSMGISQIPFDRFEHFWVADRVEYEPHMLIPSRFTLVDKKEVGLTRSDKYQFEHFRPFATLRYATFEYRISGKEK